MKNNPFQEIMDFEIERKDYVKLCKCKSKKYTYYSDWKQHIVDCIQKIADLDRLENFKRYCLCRKRLTSKSPELFGIYVVLLIDIFANLFFENVGKIMSFLFALLIILHSLIKHKTVIYESSFFGDIIEIIEKIQNKEQRSE